MEVETAALAAEGEEGGGEPVEVGGATGLLGAVRDDASSRRRFLRTVSGGVGASALAAVASACGTPQHPVGYKQVRPGEVGAFGPGDGGIVNFALFLEHIEGDFYDRVVAGDEITDRRLLDFFKQVRENEAEHRNALERIADQIGRPIDKPKSNFKGIFDRGPQRIVSFAGELENLGSAAYLGQLSLLLDRGILASALSIHTVEARQAAAFNDLAGRGFQAGGVLKGSLPTGAFAQPMTMQEVSRRIRPYFVGGVPNLRPPAD